MKRSTALYVLAAIATLSFTGQAFARGGGMGGGQGLSSMSGTHQMAATMPAASDNGMQERSMQGNPSPHGPAAGAGPQKVKQGGSGNSVSHQNGQTPGNGAGPGTKRPPVTPSTN